MLLPNGAESRALLIGTSTYETLPDVPEIRNNLWALKESLQRHTGLPAANCRSVLDPTDLIEVGREVEASTKAASDLLLIYYSGHGLVASDGLLHLALPQTSRQQRLLPWSSIPFKLLHHAIQLSRARTKVLILDCCFSGRATQLLGAEESNILGQITANGAFTLTSSPANEPSFAVDGFGYTTFTGSLLRLLENGTPRAGAMLTLGDLYLELLHHAQANHLPEPQKVGTHTAELLPLARNRRFVAGDEQAVEEQIPADEFHERLDRLKGGLTEILERPNLRAVSQDPLLTATDIDHALFKTVRFTEGYDEDEVDAFLDKVALALAEPADGVQQMHSDHVKNAEFTITRLREGYDMTEVDAFLDRVILEFERRQAFGE